jgi:RNA polymerase sigma-70 factor, ECF subfamily
MNSSTTRTAAVPRSLADRVSNRGVAFTAERQSLGLTLRLPSALAPPDEQAPRAHRQPQAEGGGPAKIVYLEQLHDRRETIATARTPRAGVPAKRSSRQSPVPMRAALPPSADTKEHLRSGDPPSRAALQDAAAFRRLYAEHGPALLRLATTLADGDHGHAEDLVQETMLRAWTHRHNSDIQHRPPRPWLMTIARRLAIDAHRARRARPREIELDERLALAYGQWADASIDEFGVRAAIAALPASQRQVLTEIYYRDRSVTETAHLLRIPAGTVRSRTFYALRALRRTLAVHDTMA